MVRGIIERPLTDDEERVIPNWLDLAWRKLQDEIPGIPDRMVMEPESILFLTSQTVADVVVAMVERKVQNPSGRRSFTTEDYTEVVDSTLSSGRIYVSDEDRKALQPKIHVANDGFYSIPLGRS